MRTETGLFVKNLKFLLHGVEAADGSCWRKSGGVSSTAAITFLMTQSFTAVSIPESVSPVEPLHIYDHVAQLRRYESASKVNLPTMGQLC